MLEKLNFRYLKGTDIYYHISLNLRKDIFCLGYFKVDSSGFHFSFAPQGKKDVTWQQAKLNDFFCYILCIQTIPLIVVGRMTIKLHLWL